MGRPKKDPADLRQYRVHIAATLSEVESYQAAAKAKGLDVSAWVRLALRRAVYEASRVIG